MTGLLDPKSSEFQSTCVAIFFVVYLILISHGICSSGSTFVFPLKSVFGWGIELLKGRASEKMWLHLPTVACVRILFVVKIPRVR